MDTIKTYIENMFATVPKTAEVLKAKEELLQNMRDKYEELKADGKSENEAIGVVISEFGNIDELIATLGVTIPANSNENTVSLDLQTAENYINNSKKSSLLVAIGVVLCILSPVILIVGSSSGLIFPGMLCLFLFIAVAVGFFIISETPVKRYEYLRKSNVSLPFNVKAAISEKQSAYLPKYNIALITGLMLCILSPVLLVSLALTQPAETPENELKILISVGVLLLMVAADVFMLIFFGAEHECYNVMLQQEDFSPENKKGSKIVDMVAGIYWPIVVAGYLLWSFLSNDWHISWLVFPVAGVLFGGISAIVKASIKND